MASSVSPRLLYLFATGSWFLAHGMHAVAYAWLVTMQLEASPTQVGLSQMLFLLPGTIFILIGGSLADRFGGRRPAMIAQTVAAVAPLLLALAIDLGQLSLELMFGYAVLLGTALAFLTPSRDGLLNQVAAGRVQRTVMLTSIVQFGMQIVGALLAASIDWSGPQPILYGQVAILLAGAVAFFLLPRAPVGDSSGARQHLLQLIADGARAVWDAPALRVIVVQNVAMGVLFMGSFIVLFPLLVREVYGGQASDLSMVNAINALGLVTTIFLLLRFGDVHRQGRALILAQTIGSVVLFGAACMPTFSGFVTLIFLWGICGGVAMTMARTIMQEQAPPAMRGRVMSFYAMSFMGAGPLGALFCGLLARYLGPASAVLVAASSMFLIMLLVAVSSVLPRIDSTEIVLAADAT
ncbi:MAG: MFS transporter [Pseudomonadota bacterium]